MRQRSSVQVDGEVPAGSDGLAHRRAAIVDLRGQMHRRLRDHRRQGIELDDVEARFNRTPGPSGEFLRVCRKADIGISPQRLAQRAAQQPVHRHARRLAGNVPKRDVDADKAEVSTAPPRQ